MDTLFNYNVESSSSEDDVDADDQHGMGMERLGITKTLADANYEHAGEEVDEEDDPISVDKFDHLIDPEIDSILETVVSEKQMPYSPSDFQRVTVNALGQMKNVVLVSPTGSGKMNVPLLATLVLRKKLNKAKVFKQYNRIF